MSTTWRPSQAHRTSQQGRRSSSHKTPSPDKPIPGC
ncbi:hypothetical protein JL09_g7067 [Pichia kudriavzevii]|uniref:Uncharacterized protein n=1 Tax=Pichia kudriavzevii TaxID=4909 RepID=A0A099NK50_PICKU|nr:hypothetical protein JL09_g7067 [Pichia kudriavzevii]